MALAPARVSMPSEAKKGDAIEIKVLVRHPMETGYRVDSVGQPIPRNILTQLTVTYNGVRVFRMEMHQGIAANPYLLIVLRANESGELVFTWTGDQGTVITERKTLTVT
ncbi:MAG: thiosulfate oxidation carrier complex protein SoxZ [Rhodomicrobium sp.]